MRYTAFETDEYDKKIRQTLPYYEDFYKQILDILIVLGNQAKKGEIFFSFKNIAMNSEKGKQIALQRWQDYQIANGKNFRMPGVLYRKIVGAVVAVFFIGHQVAVLYFFKKGIFYNIRE